MGAKILHQNSTRWPNLLFCQHRHQPAPPCLHPPLLLSGVIFGAQGYAMGLAAVAVGSVLMILELFVACLQAYIFAMLTSVFIGLIRHAH